jgi:hypothetical protein
VEIENQAAFNGGNKRDHRQEEMAVRVKQKGPASAMIHSFQILMGCTQARSAARSIPKKPEADPTLRGIAALLLAEAEALAAALVAEAPEEAGLTKRTSLGIVSQMTGDSLTWMQRFRRTQGGRLSRERLMSLQTLLH